MNTPQSLRKHSVVGIIIDDSGRVAKARRIALEEAGLDASSARIISVTESEYLGMKLFEVLFSGEELIYECCVDAETWEVVGMDCNPVAI